jgi:hypothetical protein
MSPERKPGSAAPRRVAVIALAALLLAGCASSDGGRGAECELRKGMPAETLLRCGCIVARSGGGAVLIEGYGDGVSDSITLVHYICSLGGGRYVRVAVVNGVVERVLN